MRVLLCILVLRTRLNRERSPFIRDMEFFLAFSCVIVQLLRGYSGAILHSFLNRASLVEGIRPDGFVSAILHDHLPHLIAQLLPVMDEVPRTWVRHDFAALFFQNLENQVGVRSITIGLSRGGVGERSSHAIEFGVDLNPDAFRPFDLIDRAGQFCHPFNSLRNAGANVDYPRDRMLALLLAIGALFAQGGPALTNQNGTITGVLRAADGAPAAGVRVSALARPEELKDLAAATSFAGLGETDSAGRYRLENIPPGRYYIVAGRVDAPTYYPGTVQAGQGTVITLAPGQTISGIDFVLNLGSVGRADSNNSGYSWVIPIQTRIEGGGKIPLFAAGLFPMVRVGGNTVPLSGPSVTFGLLVGAPSPSYQVTVENLPETYELKSLVSGATNLQTSALQLPPRSISSVVVPGVIVTLARRPASPTGVRVSGQLRGDAKRAIYISGNPGSVYVDGTFEFVGVAPGRHRIVALESSGAGRGQGTVIVVGERDLANIELDDIAVVPADSDRPSQPEPAGNRPPGSRSKTASIRGRVVDAETREPFNAGKIVLNRNYSASFSLDDDGKFEVPGLLPGKYVVEAAVFGIGTASREVILDEQDVALEWSFSAQP
jgi:hypothetical protein